MVDTSTSETRLVLQPGREQFLWLGGNRVLVVPTLEAWEAMVDAARRENHDPGDEDRR